MSSTRIPEGKAEFDAYIQTTYNHLNTTEPGGTAKRAETLGMTLTELTTHDNFLKAWTNPDPLHPGAYDLHKNPDTQNRLTTANADKVIADFTAFFRPILVRMSGSAAITAADRLVLNIAAPATTHTTPTSPIKEQCNVSTRPLGGGDVELEFSHMTEKVHSGFPAGADGVLITFRSVEKYKQGAELASKTRNMCNGPDDEGMKQKVLTKSTTIVKLGADKQDLELQFYLQYINTKHEELNGPLSGPFFQNIL